MQIIRFIIILAARQRGFGGVAGCRRMGGQRPSTLLCLRRPHFWPPKNGGKNRQPPSGWIPAFVQSDASKRDIQSPLNFCRAAGLLVIGAVLCRTSPDGPRAEVHFVRWKNRFIYPFKRATAEAGREARRRSDANGQNFSGKAVSNLGASDWAKAGVQPEGGWRFFPPFLGGQKWGRQRQNSVEGPDWPSRCRRRQNREKRKKEAKGRLYPLPPFSAFTEGGVPPLQVICACPGKTAP